MSDFKVQWPRFSTMEWHAHQGGPRLDTHLFELTPPPTNITKVEEV